MARILRVVPFFVGLFACVLVLNAVVAAQDLPNYGSWTGIRPLEEKLRKLDAFASEGPVDALIVGSSISDFGINAELLSDEMTAATSRPYRAFNFSTGGTELTTIPTLYRMARTVTKPRTLIVSLPEEIRRAEEVNPASPEYSLNRAPIGTAIRHPRLFPIEKRAFDVPLVRDAASIRDVLVFGGYEHLVAQGSDLYSISPSGDSLSFSYQITEKALAYLRKAHSTAVTPLTPHELATFTELQQMQHFFNDHDIRAIDDLLKITARDGCKIVLVAHDVASDYYPRPLALPAFTRARRQFYAVLSRYMHAKLINEVEKFTAAKYMVMDDVHLNYYGAAAFTHRIATQLSNGGVEPARDVPKAYPALPDIPSSDPTISNFSALIEAPTDPGTRTLQLTLLRNRAIPPLPDAPLQILLRLPNNKDVSAPARLTGPATVTARFGNLPAIRNAILLARIAYVGGGRLNAPNQPIAGYAWAR